MVTRLTRYVSILVLALVFGACAADSEDDTTERTVIGASWTTHYSDIPALARDVDLVTVGTVTGVAGTERHEQMAGRLATAVTFTDFAFAIDETILGDALAHEIIVHQTGSRIDGVVQEIGDDPLFEVGARYLLFLKHDEITGRYFVAGGPQGRFLIDGETVVPLSQIYPDRHIDDLGFDARPLSDVTADILEVVLGS